MTIDGDQLAYVLLHAGPGENDIARIRAAFAAGVAAGVEQSNARADRLAALLERAWKACRAGIGTQLSREIREALAAPPADGETVDT
jgi:hypothetical protein